MTEFYYANASLLSRRDLEPYSASSKSFHSVEAEEQDQRNMEVLFEQDNICARACEDIYHDQFCQKVTEYASAVVSPTEGQASIEPNWAILEMKDPLSREQESVILVTFRGTYSWIDVMHDLVCLPVTQSCIYWPLLRWWMRNGFSTQKLVGYRMEGHVVEFQD
ncbi:hypothetical protein GUITHDRAFT_111712 [Guillardia theta CCMP2712]|uniref:Uncharacterized protein n=1 Tax=Guillardia theta (strain CCMP2712) TaxID=905079 RepID=L1J1E7_GUITC|nr:hypothetical protein GUITHDRAFT_111712 [Guillardia theta CCMP2712]EKX42142.1 hypothetical protein GUITHDRAFT_111712 [Guillardia theta CCMP2712]|eukprot:XP_005829122.1 hypothetical protein GUITHDRAFT_111712 [Guillardia theta CCMP2712]